MRTVRAPAIRRSDPRVWPESRRHYHRRCTQPQSKYRRLKNDAGTSACNTRRGVVQRTRRRIGRADSLSRPGDDIPYAGDSLAAPARGRANRHRAFQHLRDRDRVKDEGTREITNSVVDAHPNARRHAILAESMASMLKRNGVFVD